MDCREGTVQLAFANRLDRHGHDYRLDIDDVDTVFVDPGVRTPHRSRQRAVDVEIVETDHVGS